MRVALHRVESDCFKPIYDSDISKEETLELVVPDVSADIGRILDVRGQLLISSQKARTDEIYISASVEVTVIYAADESGKVQYVMSNIPVDMTVPVPGADENTRLVSRWQLCSLDARMLNPRKLLLRANVSAHITACMPDKFVLWDNLSEDEKNVYILQKEVEHTLVVGVRDKSFVVSDEYRLPSDMDQNAKMLSASTEICVQDAKAVGNKIVVKAVANTSAVFLNENDGSLFDSIFSTQFSQIIEVDTYGDDVETVVTILLKDAEFSMITGRDNGFLCSAMLNMTAQAVCRENKTSMYVADAYSNKFELTPETEIVKLTKCYPSKTLMLNMRDRLQSKDALTEIRYADITTVCAEVDGGDIKVTVLVGGVATTESGESVPVELRLTAGESVPLTKNQKLTIVSVCCEKAVLTGTALNAEISVDLTLTYGIKESAEISAVSSLEICEDCTIYSNDRPSLVVLCADKNIDLWTLAKKYGSTTEMIKNANMHDGEFSADCRPLLIPRAK